MRGYTTLLSFVVTGMMGSRNGAVSGHECGNKDVFNIDKLKQVCMLTGNALVNRGKLIDNDGLR